MIVPKRQKNAPWRTGKCIKARWQIRQRVFIKTSRGFSKSS
jgi:hypothetical protein